MDEKRNEERRKEQARENPPELEKFLGPVLPDAQVREGDRRTTERRENDDEDPV
jgi:hypothetical protein